MVGGRAKEDARTRGRGDRKRTTSNMKHQTLTIDCGIITSGRCPISVANVRRSSGCVVSVVSGTGWQCKPKEGVLTRGLTSPAGQHGGLSTFRRREPRRQGFVRRLADEGRGLGSGGGEPSAHWPAARVRLGFSFGGRPANCKEDANCSRCLSFRTCHHSGKRDSVAFRK